MPRQSETKNSQLLLSHQSNGTSPGADAFADIENSNIGETTEVVVFVSACCTALLINVKRSALLLADIFEDKYDCEQISDVR